MSNRLALCDVSGSLTDLLQKLSGENGDEWQSGLNRFLRKKNPWGAVAAPEPKVFKTINLGTGLRTADDFSRAFNENGCKASDWTEDILGKPEFTVATDETQVDLVVLSVRELGFPEGATRRDIYDSAGRLGLALCPAEVGLQLRLKYRDQPKGEWLLIAMEPITGSNGRPDVFGVERGDEALWFYNLCGGPGGYWSAGTRWVFCRPE